MAHRGLTSTQQFWLEHVEACATAGVSMKAYAERHGLSLQSFYGWKGQLKKLGLVMPRASTSTDANAFAPVTFRALPRSRNALDTPSRIGARLSLSNGITIEVPAGVSPEGLGRLIAAAMDVSCDPQEEPV